MMFERYVRNSFYTLIAAGCMAVSAGTACADAFTHPADGAYSLKRIFDRPYLQSTPMSQVWQTNPSSDEMRRAWLDAWIDETVESRRREVLLESLDAQDRRGEYQRYMVSEPAADSELLHRIFKEMFPVVEAAGENVMSFSDKQDESASLLQMSNSDAEVSETEKQLYDMTVFTAVVDENAEKDVEFAALAAMLKDGQKKSDKTLSKVGKTLLSDEILNRAADYGYFETAVMAETDDLNRIEVLMAVDDMLDLGTVQNMLLSDEDRDFYKSSSRIFSFLDTDGKTEQIQKTDRTARRQAVIDRLKEKISGKNKDVK